MNCVSILVTVIIINWNFRGPRTHKMPNWIRVVFLKYLPVLLFMKRPKKTRLRWMMDMPGLHYQHFHPSYHQQQGGSPEIKQCNVKSKVEFMELSDIGGQHPHGHHPNCTIAAQQPQRKASLDRDRDALRDNESIDMLFLTPEAYRAAEAIEFIAEHLRSEDEYIQVLTHTLTYYYNVALVVVVLLALLLHYSAHTSTNLYNIYYSILYILYAIYPIYH